MRGTLGCHSRGPAESLLDTRERPDPHHVSDASMQLERENVATGETPLIKSFMGSPVIAAATRRPCWKESRS
jgi:hypothetical protein